VSRNPVFSFRLKGVKAGDKLEIAWLDNRGERSRAEAAIA
jgi:sulfur-oxidizing protein SoxZ